MHDQRELHEGIWRLGPACVQIVGAPEHVGGVDVTDDEERRVVRDVVALLDRAHPRRRRGEHRLAVAKGVLARRVLPVDLLLHRPPQQETRVRLVPVHLASHDHPLARELLIVEERRGDRVPHERHGAVEVIGGGREEVVHPIVAGPPVPLHAELAQPRAVRELVPEHLVPLEEHVLVEVREPVVLRRLGHRAVVHRDLDRDERRCMTLHDDDLETVGADVARVRRRRRGKRGRGGKESDDGNRDGPHVALIVIQPAPARHARLCGVAPVLLPTLLVIRSGRTMATTLARGRASRRFRRPPCGRGFARYERLRVQAGPMSRRRDWLLVRFGM